MYARGILFGKMVIELGDTCTVRNVAQNFHADLEFKTKGFFSGTYNAIAGRVKHGPTDLGDVSGKWSAIMEFKTAKVNCQAHHPLCIFTYLLCKTGEKRTLYNVQKSGHDVAPKWIAAEDEQEQNESRRLWRDLTRAILAKDMDAATEAKTAVENAQRELRASGVKHATRFFELRDDNCWVPRIQCVLFLSIPLKLVSMISLFASPPCSSYRLPQDPQEATAAVQAWIWSRSSSEGSAAADH